ncbi:MAG: hypothetical protein EA375_02185 [Acholeplasmataceae bacterium]|nr:MAG: hypothetical protein EA375_02185 [Acholeplasmataceae bacterium]
MVSLAFLRKEIQEMVKTPKLIIIASVFVFFAIIGPLTAKYMNELIAMFASDIEISFPDPTYVQSWEQFYSNITSISMIVFLILMTGTVVAEKNKGSIYLMLTKNVTRTSFLVSKMIAGILLFTTVFIMSVLISWYYTWMLFDQVTYEGLALSLLSIFMLGIFFTMVAVLLSVLLKSTTHAALLAFAAYAILNILTILSDINPYNPAGATTLALNQLKGVDAIQPLLINVLISLVITIILAIASIRIFNKQEL